MNERKKKDEKGKFFHFPFSFFRFPFVKVVRYHCMRNNRWV